MSSGTYGHGHYGRGRYGIGEKMIEPQTVPQPYPSRLRDMGTRRPVDPNWARPKR